MKNLQINGHNFKFDHENPPHKYFKCVNCKLEIFKSLHTMDRYITANGKIVTMHDDNLTCNDYIVKSIIE